MAAVTALITVGALPLAARGIDGGSGARGFRPRIRGLGDGTNARTPIIVAVLSVRTLLSIGSSIRMKAGVLAILRSLLLMIGSATAVSVGRRGAARERVEGARYRTLREVVVRRRGVGSRTLGSHLGKAVLRTEHHLLVSPLCELGISRIKVGSLGWELVGVCLAGLLLVLKERRVKGSRGYGGRPAALRLLLERESVGRLLELLDMGLLLKMELMGRGNLG